MYYIIEDSPSGENIVGRSETREEASAILRSLYNNFCNYYIAKLC